MAVVVVAVEVKMVVGWSWWWWQLLSPNELKGKDASKQCYKANYLIQYSASCTVWKSQHPLIPPTSHPFLEPGGHKTSSSKPHHTTDLVSWHNLEEWIVFNLPKSPLALVIFAMMPLVVHIMLHWCTTKFVDSTLYMLAGDQMLKKSLIGTDIDREIKTNVEIDGKLVDQKDLKETGKVQQAQMKQNDRRDS